MSMSDRKFSENLLPGFVDFERKKRIAIEMRSRRGGRANCRGEGGIGRGAKVRESVMPLLRDNKEEIASSSREWTSLQKHRSRLPRPISQFRPVFSFDACVAYRYRSSTREQSRRRRPKNEQLRNNLNRRRTNSFEEKHSNETTKVEREGRRTEQEGSVEIAKGQAHLKYQSESHLFDLSPLLLPFSLRLLLHFLLVLLRLDSPTCTFEPKAQ